MMREPLIFVYGTLRRGSTHHHLISAVADYLMQGSVAGKLYDIGPYPGLVIPPNTTQKVTGDVYKMRDVEKAITVLDEYEACSTAFAQPTEYRRQLAEVTLDNGQKMSAWVYIYNRSIKHKPEILSGDYVNKTATRTHRS